METKIRRIIGFLIIICLVTSVNGFSQNEKEEKDRKDIIAVIDQYSLAREKQDTVLLKSILTNDIDQLVSTGEWRYGISVAVKGMIQSSNTNEGQRTITVEKVKKLNKDAAIADARYEIKPPTGEVRKMWSTFIVVRTDKKWKIASIRNMAPKENR